MRPAPNQGTEDGIGEWECGGDVVVKRPGERESDIGGVQAQPNQVIGALPGVLIVSDAEPEVPACVAGVDLVPLVA